MSNCLAVGGFNFPPQETLSRRMSALDPSLAEIVQRRLPQVLFAVVNDQGCVSQIPHGLALRL
ncbi:MAG: hypothetical protein KDI66_11560 [Xanthomonadales bacterium]|nr:hypothetical protein [Xanthomonadales bacterium]